MSRSGLLRVAGWRWLGALMLVAGVGQGACAQAQIPAPVPASAPTVQAPEWVELGRRTYIGMCARCHGINLVTQGIGFDLRKFPRDGRERFNRSVTQGVRAMPSFATSLSPAQLDSLWAYIGSVNGWE